MPSATKPVAASPKGRRSVPRPSDIDLTGGFRLDLKTLALVILLVASWYNQTSKIDNLSARLDLQEQARTEVEKARKETEDAELRLAAQQQRNFESALGELKAQLKLTAMDVGDLKVLAAAKTR
jgi:sortase (surface protein transpeptidase)